MRTWARLKRDGFCGRCGAFMRANSPAVFISGGTTEHQWQLVRGQCCAGQAPVDLPREHVLQQWTSRFSHVMRAAPKSPQAIVAAMRTIPEERRTYGHD